MGWLDSLRVALRGSPQSLHTHGTNKGIAMKDLFVRLARFVRETRAVSALEYAILVGVVAVALVAALGTFSDEIIEGALTKVGHQGREPRQRDCNNLVVAGLVRKAPYGGRGQAPASSLVPIALAIVGRDMRPRCGRLAQGECAHRIGTVSHVEAPSCPRGRCRRARNQPGAKASFQPPGPKARHGTWFPFRDVTPAE